MLIMKVSKGVTLTPKLRFQVNAESVGEENAMLESERPANCPFCRLIVGNGDAVFFTRDARVVLNGAQGKFSHAWSDKDPNVFVMENQYMFCDTTSLVIPGWHYTQDHEPIHTDQMRMWRNMQAIGRAARDHGHQQVRLMQEQFGERAPRGFRIFCNFGRNAEQTQSHAHLHVHATQALDASRYLPTGEPYVHAARRINNIVEQTECTLFYDILPAFEQAQAEMFDIGLRSKIRAKNNPLPRVMLLAVPREDPEQSQWDLWEDVGQVGQDATEFMEYISGKDDFRVMANFTGQQNYGPAHLLLVSGPLTMYGDYY